MEKKREELVSQLSYEIAKEMAPEELDLFNDIKEEFLKNPDAFSEKDPQKREQMLGFAIPWDVKSLITTFILPVVWKVIKENLSKFIDAKLDSEEVQRLRDEAYNIAISLEMDKDKAEVMADSLVGKLAKMDLL